MRAPSIFALCLSACAAQTAAAPGAEPVAVAAPPQGNGGMALEIRNEVTSLGTLVYLAVFLDGSRLFQHQPLNKPHMRMGLSTTGGRHHLCVAAHYEGLDPEGTYVVRAPRLVELIPGSTVSLLLRLQQQLTPQPYATAQYQGGLPYAATTTPDPEKYDRRLDELCGNRP